ncbi:GNAT family N-acetyltransferase [bacterium]|nr:GNAT family N-acetyltransferase [bacterium]
MKLIEKFLSKHRKQSEPSISVRSIKESDYPKVRPKIVVRWGSTIIVTKGRSHDILGLEGFITEVGSNIVGYIFYEIINNDVEIALLDSFRKNLGIGTILTQRVIDLAKNRGLNRVFVITTNDNTHALRFYQKIGFDFYAIHRDAVIEKQKLKPEITLTGYHWIPVRHEIELEYLL